MRESAQQRADRYLRLHSRQSGSKAGMGVAAKSKVTNVFTPHVEAIRIDVLPGVARECYKWLLCPTQDDPTAAKATVENAR